MAYLSFASKWDRRLFKSGENFSFFIKSIDIYVLLCCCSKGKRVKK